MKTCECGCGGTPVKPESRFLRGHQHGQLRERLFSRLVIDPSGCLLWTGCRDNWGYGRIRTGGRRQQEVHRVMWELLEGPVPDGLMLDHVKARGCVNRHCASIAHLEPVTPAENNRRSSSASAVNAAKTHCDSGHEFTEANTYTGANGARECRACGRDSQRRYKARKRAAA